MVNPIEELLQIDVHHPALSVADVVLRLADRLMRPPRPGRKPKLLSEKVGSKSGCNTWCSACWMSRSTRVGTPSVLTPPAGLRDVHPSNRSGYVSAFQQGLLHALPVHLQPVREPGDGDLIDPRCTVVPDHPLIRQPQVAAFDHRFHQPVVLRFRSPGYRRARLSAPVAHARLPACTSHRGHPCGCSCFSVSLRDHPSYSRLPRSALRHRCLLWPLLTSAAASGGLATTIASRHDHRSPRVLRTFLPRLCASDIRHCVPYTYPALCTFLPACPAMTPLSASCSSRQRFAFSFLQTPSRPGSPCRQLALPRVGWAEDFHLQVSAPCRAHRKSRAPCGARPV